MANLIPIDGAATLEAVLKQRGLDGINVWQGANQLRTIAPAAEVLEQIPTWLTEHRLAYKPEGNMLFITPQAFRFGRGAEAHQLRTTEQQATQFRVAQERALATAKNYEEHIRASEAEAARLKAQLATPLGGKSLDEIMAAALTWPTVIDIQIGPDVDAITGVFIDPGVIHVTFLPALYDGKDYGLPTHFLPTNPIRFALSEVESSVKGIAGRDLNYLTTFHPHMSRARVCEGQLGQVLRTFTEANDVLGVLALLDEYRVGHRANDYANHGWGTQVAAWWAKFLKRRQENENEAWLFNGRWDGETVQVAEGRDIVKLTDFFGASMEDIVHVMSAPNKPHVSAAAVATYRDTIGAAQPNPCALCGREVRGCACHEKTCVGCNLGGSRCDCAALDGFVRTEVLELQVAGMKFRRPLPREAGLHCSRCDSPAIVWVINERTAVCAGHTYEWINKQVFDRALEWETRCLQAKNAGQPEPLRGTLVDYTGRRACDVGRRYYGDRWGANQCHETAIKMFVESQVQLSFAGEYVPQYFCRTHIPGRPPTMRHRHDHDHEGFAIAALHDHWHEHPVDDMGRIVGEVEHDQDHAAFRFARADTPREHRERM
jgi:hypothetical protein